MRLFWTLLFANFHSINAPDIMEFRVFNKHFGYTGSKSLKLIYLLLKKLCQYWCFGSQSDWGKNLRD